MDDPTKDTIPRSAVEYCLRKETVSTNPEKYKTHEKFIDYMNDPDISEFGHWMHSNGFNCALTTISVDLKKIPSVTPSSQPEPIRLRLDHELSKEECERLKKDCAEQPIILLPKESAQPGEDIRAMCGECDAWNQYKNYPQPGWIPWDSGKFPEESGCYIVTAYDGSGSRVTFAKYQKRLKRWELTGARAYWRVLAWQPLPTPYREGR